MVTFLGARSCFLTQLEGTFRILLTYEFSLKLVWNRDSTFVILIDWRWVIVDLDVAILAIFVDKWSHHLRLNDTVILKQVICVLWDRYLIVTFVWSYQLLGPLLLLLILSFLSQLMVIFKQFRGELRQMRHFIEPKSIVTLLMRFQTMDVFDKVACRALLICFTVGLFKHAFVWVQVLVESIAPLMVV